MGNYHPRHAAPCFNVADYSNSYGILELRYLTCMMCSLGIHAGMAILGTVTRS